MAKILDQTILDKYEPTIGLEIHVQLDTKSKMFCRCDNNSEMAMPNTNVCEVCMGYPGTLPVANAQAMTFGVRLAVALGCKINEFQRFDRKNYFYPDLPKGYQISQFFYPVGEHGEVVVDYLAPDRKTKNEFTVGITRLHLEEDAGKLTHGADGSLVDLNRCGTPLAEIVTGPDIHSPEEARAFMQELQRVVRKLGVSRADMDKGHMRVDGNISVRLKGATELGAKVEIKNINSFKFLEQALAYEISRQIEMLEAGDAIVQETRGWDEKSNATISQRIKEGSVDYRYFPDPDLPPTVYSADEIMELSTDLVMMPAAVRAVVEGFGLPYSRVDELQSIAKEGGEATALEWVRAAKEADPDMDVNLLANWVGQEFSGFQEFEEFVRFVRDNELSAHKAALLFGLKAEGKDRGLRDLYETLGDVSGDDMLGMVREIVVANPAEAERYRAGETKLIGFFVGQLMAKAGGSADPATARTLIEKTLTESE